MMSERKCLIEGCEQKMLARGLCRPHYYAGKRKGNLPPTIRAANGAPNKFLLDNVHYTGDDCLTWPFGRHRYGYAWVRWGGESLTGSHVMCVLAHGLPPTDQGHAAHSCKGGPLGCVNPRHLRWASPQENAEDKIVHSTQPVGEKIWNAILNEDNVRYIRKSSLDHEALSQKFGVARRTIRDVLTRRSWKHID